MSFALLPRAETFAVCGDPINSTMPSLRKDAETHGAHKADVQLSPSLWTAYPICFFPLPNSKEKNNRPASHNAPEPRRTFWNVPQNKRNLPQQDASVNTQHPKSLGSRIPTIIIYTLETTAQQVSATWTRPNNNVGQWSMMLNDGPLACPCVLWHDYMTIWDLRRDTVPTHS